VDEKGKNNVLGLILYVTVVASATNTAFANTGNESGQTLLWARFWGGQDKHHADSVKLLDSLLQRPQQTSQVSVCRLL